MTSAIQRQQRWHSVHLQSPTTANWNFPSFFIVAFTHNQSVKQKTGGVKERQKHTHSGIYAFLLVCLSFTQAEYCDEVRDDKRVVMKVETAPQGGTFPLIRQWEFLQAWITKPW